MEEILRQILSKIDTLGDKIDAHDRSNKEDFKRIDKKIDVITEVVAKTMEDVVEIRSQLKIQDTEIKVLKGGM